MDNLGQMRTALQSDLTVDSGSTLYPVSTIDLSLNRAYRKIGGLFRWPELEDSKLTSTESGFEYYDYPSTWQPDSIWKLKVDGVDYGDPLSFKDYLYEKENSLPSGLEKIWSSQWRRFFIYPIPNATGSNNIEVHGQKTITSMSDASDVTIFSYSMPEVNEAIVLEAKAILKGKVEDQNGSAFASSEAKQITLIAWGKIKQNQAKYERTTPMLNVTDMFAKGNSNDKLGDFNI